MALFGILRSPTEPQPALPNPAQPAAGAATLPGVATSTPPKPWVQPGLVHAPGGRGVNPAAKKPSVKGQIANFVSQADDKDWDMPRRMRAAPFQSRMDAFRRQQKKSGGGLLGALGRTKMKMPKMAVNPELQGYLKAAREPWGLAKGSYYIALKTGATKFIPKLTAASEARVQRFAQEASKPGNKEFAAKVGRWGRGFHTNPLKYAAGQGRTVPLGTFARKNRGAAGIYKAEIVRRSKATGKPLDVKRSVYRADEQPRASYQVHAQPYRRMVRKAVPTWGLAKRELSEAEIEQRRLAARERWARYRRGVENTAIGTAAGGVYGGLLGALGRTKMKMPKMAVNPELQGYLKSTRTWGLQKFDETKIHRDGDGQFAEKDYSLTQPAQLVAGSVAGALGAYGGAKLAERHGNKIAEKFGRRMGARVLLADKRAVKTLGKPNVGLMARMMGQSEQQAHQLVRRQAHMVSHLGRMGAKAGLVGAGALAGSLAGDFAGDWGARRATGAQGANDEYRHQGIMGQIGGAIAGTIGGVAASANRVARRRWTSAFRTRAGLAAGAVGAAAGEMLGNIGDAKYNLTTNLVGQDRRMVRSAPEPTGLAKFDSQAHPRAEDGKFTEKAPGAGAKSEGARSRMAGGAPRPRMVAGIYSRGPQWEERAPKTRDPAMNVGPTKDMDYRHRKAYARFRDDLANNPPPAPRADAQEAPAEAPDVSALAEGKRFKRFTQKPQKPSGMSEAKYVEMGRWANQRLRDMRDEVITGSIGRNDPGGHKHALMIPRDADPKDPAIKAAFNHAKNLALHDVGLIHYDFEMQPEHIEALTPYKAFIKHARRKMGDVLRRERPGEWAQFRREFGTPFSPAKYYEFDTNGQKKGEEKKRFKRHDVLLKSDGGQLSAAEIQQRRDAAKARWSRHQQEKMDLLSPYTGGRPLLSDMTVARMKAEGKWTKAHEQNQAHTRALKAWHEDRDAARGAWIKENQHRSTAASPMQRKKILSGIFEREVPPPPLPKSSYVSPPGHVVDQLNDIEKKMASLLPHTQTPQPPPTEAELEAGRRRWAPASVEPAKPGIEAAEAAKYEAWREGVQRQATERETGARAAREGKRRAVVARREFGVKPDRLVESVKHAAPARLGRVPLKGLAAAVAGGAVLGAAGYGVYQHWRKAAPEGDLQKLSWGGVAGMARGAIGSAAGSAASLAGRGARSAVGMAGSAAGKAWGAAARRMRGSSWSGSMKGYRTRLGAERASRMGQIRQAQDAAQNLGVADRFHEGARESARLMREGRARLNPPKPPGMSHKTALGLFAAGGGGLAAADYYEARN